MNTKGQMRLGAFFNPTGHHVASWRQAKTFYATLKGRMAGHGRSPDEMKMGSHLGWLCRKAAYRAFVGQSRNRLRPAPRDNPTVQIALVARANRHHASA